GFRNPLSVQEIPGRSAPARLVCCVPARPRRVSPRSDHPPLGSGTPGLFITIYLLVALLKSNVHPLNQQCSKANKDPSIPDPSNLSADPVPCAWTVKLRSPQVEI